MFSHDSLSCAELCKTYNYVLFVVCAEILLQQAMAGSSPNSLLLSYLKHTVLSQVSTAIHHHHHHYLTLNCEVVGAPQMIS